MPSTEPTPEHATAGVTTAEDATPVTELAGTDVYAADGVRVGRVVDVVVDAEAGVASALVLDDVSAAAVGPLPEGVDRARLPYRLVRDGADVVVLSVATADDAGAEEASDGNPPADGADAGAARTDDGGGNVAE